MARRKRKRSWIRRLFTRWQPPPGYTDDQGRECTAGGFLVDKQFGDDDFRRDFTRQPGWQDRNDGWWRRWGMFDYGFFGIDSRGKIAEFEEIYTDPRYFRIAGDEVLGYDGPYLDYNAVQYLSRRGVRVPDWAQLRQASHSDQRIQYPGWGGSPPESYGATWTWRRGLRLHRRAR